MRVSPYQGDFSAGEVGPDLYGRVDSDRYKSAVAQALNFIPLTSGPIKRRSGTKYHWESRRGTLLDGEIGVLIPFVFSNTQAYVVEIAVTHVRFHTETGIVTDSNGDPYEITCPFPFSTGHLNKISVRQNNDVLYFFQEDFPPYKLIRHADADWEFVRVEFVDGPYEDIYPYDVGLKITTSYAAGPTAPEWTHQVDVTKIADVVTIDNAPSGPFAGLVRVDCSAAHGLENGRFVTFDNTGSILDDVRYEIVPDPSDDTLFYLKNITTTVSVSGVGEIYPSVFQDSDEGRLVRVLIGSTWDYGEISNAGGVAGGRTARFRLQNQYNTGLPKTIDDFRLGVFCSENGYPSVAAFHEERLFLTGVPNLPWKIMASAVGDYESHAPSDLSGTVVASDAFTFDIPETNRAQWMESDEKGILVGTLEAEYYIRGASNYEGISATNIVVRKSTNYGSGSPVSVLASKSALFVRGSEKKVSDIQYYYDVDGFRVTDLSVLAPHILKEGVRYLQFQKEPTPTLWCLLADGTVGCLVYERDLDGLRAGWYKFVLGGTEARVTSIASIPSATGGQSQVWLQVERTINGSKEYSIEILQPEFGEDDALEDAWFVDGGLEYDGTIGVVNVLNLNPAPMYAPAHGLTTGDTIRIGSLDDFDGANGQEFTVTVLSADAFEVDGLDLTSMAVPSTSGVVYAVVDTVSGLSHLEGETVKVMADGHVLEDKVVSSGAISLGAKYIKVRAGVKFTSRLKTLRIDAGAQDGTSIGKKRRINAVSLMLRFATMFKVGPTFDKLKQIVMRKATDNIEEPINMFEGLYETPIASTHDTDNSICIEVEDPVPLSILAIAPQMSTHDKG